jgi:hypothetical protein
VSAGEETGRDTGQEAGKSHLLTKATARSPRRSTALLLLAAAGALWGAVSYAILWGETSIVVTRRFVDSNRGLALLLPVRLVLEAIRVVEKHVAGHPFDFSHNHGWIGFAAAAAGAAMLALPGLLVTAVARRLRRRGPLRRRP